MTIAALFFGRENAGEDTMAGAAWAGRCWGVPWAIAGVG